MEAVRATIQFADNMGWSWGHPCAESRPRLSFHPLLYVYGNVLFVFTSFRWSSVMLEDFPVKVYPEDAISV